MNPEDTTPLIETRISQVDDVVVIQLVKRPASIFPDPVLEVVRRIQADVNRLLAEGRRTFVIDLSSIDSLDSACLGEIVSASKQVRQSAGVLKVILSERLAALWKRMGLGMLVSACATLDEAVADVRRTDRAD